MLCLQRARSVAINLSNNAVTQGPVRQLNCAYSNYCKKVVLITHSDLCNVQ